MRVSHREAGWLELSTPLPKRATSDELYEAMDALGERQQEIEQCLAR
jgi:hypothetical protein